MQGGHRSFSKSARRAGRAGAEGGLRPFFKVHAELKLTTCPRNPACEDMSVINTDPRVAIGGIVPRAASGAADEHARFPPFSRFKNHLPSFARPWTR